MEGNGCDVKILGNPSIVRLHLVSGSRIKFRFRLSERQEWWSFWGWQGGHANSLVFEKETLT